MTTTENSLRPACQKNLRPQNSVKGSARAGNPPVIGFEELESQAKSSDLNLNTLCKNFAHN